MERARRRSLAPRSRYNKSLTHCAKFFDLSPEQTKEVDEVKLSLNLNMAMVSDAEWC